MIGLWIANITWFIFWLVVFPPMIILQIGLWIAFWCGLFEYLKDDSKKR